MKTRMPYQVSSQSDSRIDDQRMKPLTFSSFYPLQRHPLAHQNAGVHCLLTQKARIGNPTLKFDRDILNMHDLTH